jgi:hypothetical protein
MRSHWPVAAIAHTGFDSAAFRAKLDCLTAGMPQLCTASTAKTPTTHNIPRLITIHLMASVSAPLSIPPILPAQVLPAAELCTIGQAAIHV